METSTDSQLVLGRFSRLMTDLMRGQTSRNTFERWEIELLVDIESCGLAPKRAREVLRRYRKAVERQLDYGVTPPLRLSEYLKQRQEGSGRRGGRRE